MGVLLRIRRLVFGRSSGGSTASSAIREAARLRPGYLAPEPGPFDEAPRERVELDPGELPWELRED